MSYEQPNFLKTLSNNYVHSFTYHICAWSYFNPEQFRWRNGHWQPPKDFGCCNVTCPQFQPNTLNKTLSSLITWKQVLLILDELSFSFYIQKDGIRKIAARMRNTLRFRTHPFALTFRSLSEWLCRFNMEKYIVFYKSLSKRLYQYFINF